MCRRDVALVVVLGVLTPVAGIGLLYLLRGAGIAPVGPRAAGALPLEQLDGTDGQPLLRMAIAWLPAGLVVGGVVAAFTRSSVARLVAALTLIAGVVLVVSGGVSESIENNEALTAHLTAPLGLAGTWVALVLFVIGVAIGERLGAASSRVPSAA